MPESLCISADQGVRDAIWSPHELRRFWRNPLVSLSGRGGGGSSQSLPQLVDSEALRPPDSKLSKGESRAASGSCFNSSPSGTSWGSGGRAEGRACEAGAPLAHVMFGMTFFMSFLDILISS